MERGVPGLKHSNNRKGPFDMTDLPAFGEFAAADQGLVVFTTLRRDGSAQASVVNAGVLPHPLTNEPVVGLVAIGGARKLAHLRADPRTTVTARTGWRWATVEGTAQLIGPDDPHPDVDEERLRVMLREIFTAAGGTHDDWDTYDRVMREERRTAVLITPDRVYTNPSGG
jgi:PPOX class probable F420-dependent enzyme